MDFTHINAWEFLAGLGIFLLAMVLLEDALEQLAGRSFKKFLRRNTNHPLKAIFSGTLVTAILQSSSVVSLMVLAFVGAGIIELQNALGIIIGSNLGTTFTGWIVATLGFSLDIENFAFPFIGLGGLLVTFFSKETKLYQIGQFLIGFGFLFLGLEYMKSSIAVLAEGIDISPFAGRSIIWLFLLGLVLTAIIQSSSASMVIALSALSSQIISLEGAAAMVIGNDLGTTITVVLGGIKGTPAKKRVAMSHFLFNLIIDLIALVGLYPLLSLLTNTIGIKNPMLTLVAFHSSFNLIGIILFFPFLGVFARFLERRFQKDDTQVARYISMVPTKVPEAAIEALRKETIHLINRVFFLHLSILQLDKSILGKEQLTFDKGVQKQYELIKEVEGEIIEFNIAIQNQKLERTESAKLGSLIATIRHTMSAAKGMKDIVHNIKEFDKSLNDHLIDLLDLIKQNQQEWYKGFYALFKSEQNLQKAHNLERLKQRSKENYNSFLEETHLLVENAGFSGTELSTIFNVNREIHASNKALVLGLKELLN